MQLVKRQIDGAIGTLTIANAAKRNALNARLVAEVIDGLDAFAAAATRVAILRAEPGVQVWSAGHDVSELPASGRDPLGWNDSLRALVRAIETFPAPVIAMIEGDVWGGAVEVVLACDIVIAAPETRFAITPARFGVPYNVSGMVTFMSAATLRVVKELLFTARPIDAARAERLGMVNHVIAADAIERFTLDMAAVIADNAPLAIRVMKEELRVLSAARPISPGDFEKVQGQRRSVYDSEDYAEGIRSFKEKRKPRFTGR